MILKLKCRCGRLLATATRPKSRPQIVDDYGPTVEAQPGVERSEHVHADVEVPYLAYRIRCSTTRDAETRRAWRDHSAMTPPVGTAPRRERRPNACGGDHQFTEAALARTWNYHSQRRQKIAVVVLGKDL